MATLYRHLFTEPGTGNFVIAGLLARIPLPMAGIGIITLLSQQRGGYALAGAVSATFVLTYALLSPQISRYVDRYGQRRVLPAATAISITGLFILMAGSHWNVTGCASVFRRSTGRIYAQHVCHGTGPLDGAVPGAAPFADSLFT